MKQNENDQNHKKESTPVVDNKPNGKSQMTSIKATLKPHTIGRLLVAVLFCSSAIADPLRPQLPADVTMNKDAGRGNWLIVTLRLDSGQELPFVVDTGCPKTILDKSLEPELGKQLGVITIWTLGGKRRTGLYAAPKLPADDRQQHYNL
jgi:hypothetical protein